MVAGRFFCLFARANGCKYENIHILGTLSLYIYAILKNVPLIEHADEKTRELDNPLEKRVQYT